MSLQYWEHLPTARDMAAWLALPTVQRGGDVARMAMTERLGWELVYARTQSRSVQRARADFDTWLGAYADTLHTEVSR